jgi:hypothetical protein
MKIYAVLAVSIDADYPYHADIISYHKTSESANKKADEINEKYEYAKSNGWHDKYGNPLCIYQSKATVSEITVLD